MSRNVNLNCRNILFLHETQLKQYVEKAHKGNLLRVAAFRDHIMGLKFLKRFQPYTENIYFYLKAGEDSHMSCVNDF